VARRKQPINAGVPAAKAPVAEVATTEAEAKPERPAIEPGPKPEPAAEAPPAPAKPEQVPRPKRRRKPIPLALKLIAATVALAIAFIVAAILGGRGSDNAATPPGAAAPVSGGPSKANSAAAEEASSDLGYPAFATKNTTRIGGEDAAANAAAVALATFPSTTPRQRPVAVTLVNEDEWQAAIAASALMALPVRAPVLISTPSDLPGPTSKAFDALNPLGSGASLGTQAFVVGDVATPGGLLHIKRIDAGEPAATAAAIARVRDQLFGIPKHVIVAPLDDPAFAMPAAAWAARSGDPVLFTGAGKLPAATAKALRQYASVPVFVLGPSSAISSAVVREISAIAGGVQRVSGEDPVGNSIALARYARGDFGWNVNDPGHGFVIARSDSPLDAAAAAPLSAAGTWGPLLLTDNAGTLPHALRDYLLDVKPGYTTDPTRAFYNHVWVIGDQEAIDVNQQAEIDHLAELTKIGGQP
jgi:putative cell wall binding repeat protein